ncbi:preprotein translocase subunit SecE [bacterium]|nr:MAG: preprotein translocase subunit SecE [bacterium]
MLEKLKTFLKESYQEFKKVRWPTREELIGLTIAVVVSSILLLIFVGVVDRLFFLLVKFVLG